MTESKVYKRLIVLMIMLLTVACVRQNPQPDPEIQPTNTITIPAPTIVQPTVTPAPLELDYHTIPEATNLTQLGKGMVRDIEISPDGELLAVVTPDTLYLYDASTFAELWHVEHIGSIKQVQGIRWSPNSQYLLVEYFKNWATGEIVVWDVDNQEKQFVYEGRSRSHFGYEWSPDSSRFAAVIWEQDQSDALSVFNILSGENEFVTDSSTFFWTKDGRYFLHNQDDSVLFRDGTTYEIMLEKEVGGFSLTGVNNIILLNEYQNDTVSIVGWDITTGEERYRLRGMVPYSDQPHTNIPYFLAAEFDDDGIARVNVVNAETGQIVDSVQNDTFLRYWSVRWLEASSELILFPRRNTSLWTGDEQMYRWQFEESRFEPVPLSKKIDYVDILWLEPDQCLLAFENDDQVVEIDLDTGEVERVFHEHVGPQRKALWSPTDDTIVSHSSSEVLLWDIETQRLISSLPVSAMPIWDIAYHPTEPLLSVFSGESRVSVWNTITQERIAQFTMEQLSTSSYSNYFRGMAWIRDGEQLLFASDNGLYFIEADDWQLHQFIAIDTGGFRPDIFSISPDHRQLIYGNEFPGEQLLHRVDLETGEYTELWEGVYGFYWMPDNTLHLMSRVFGGAQLWNVDTDEAMSPILPIQSDVRKFRPFSPQKYRFISIRDTSEGSFLIMWDLQSGNPIERLLVENSNVPAWSADGSTLLIPFRDGQLLLWELSEQ